MAISRTIAGPTTVAGLTVQRRTSVVTAPSVPQAPAPAFTPVRNNNPLPVETKPSRPKPAVVEQPAPVIATAEQPAPVNNANSPMSAARVYKETIDPPARVTVQVNNSPEPPVIEKKTPEPAVTFTTIAAALEGTTERRPADRPVIIPDEPRTIEDKQTVHVNTGEPRTANPTELGFSRTETATGVNTGTGETTERKPKNSVPVETEPQVNQNNGISPWAVIGAGTAGVGGGVILEKLIDNVKEKKIEKAQPAKKDNTLIMAGVGLLALFILSKILKK